MNNIQASHDSRIEPRLKHRARMMRELFRFLAALGVALLYLLAEGCSSSDPNTPPPVEQAMLSGTITGFAPLLGDDGIGGVGVLGSSGFNRVSAPLARTTAGQTAIPYTVLLQDLDAPYLAQALVGNDPNSGAQLFYYTVTTGAGTANLTPLTSLLVAQLFASDVSPLFLGSDQPINIAGPDVINQMTIDLAQRRATAYLENVLGVPVRSGTASFVDAPFTAVAGDPMYDTILDLNTKLADNGSDLATLYTNVANAAFYCQAERLPVTIGGGDEDEVCPATKSALADAGDASITVYDFSALTGNVLTISARDGTVLSIQFTAAGGSSYGCDTSTCAGATLSSPAANGTRQIAFAGTTLPGSAGSVTLDGSLISAYPGTTYTVPPCVDNKFIIVRPDGNVDAACLGFNQGFARGLERRVYAFNNFRASVPGQFQQLEIAADDQSIYSALVATSDPDTFVTTADFVCRTVACNNIAVGPADSSGMRRITLNAARIPATDGGDSVLIDATFSIATPVQDFTPPDCSTATANIVSVAFSDEASSLIVCGFLPDSGFGETPSTFINDEAGNLSYLLQDIYTTADGSTTTGGETIQVDTTAGIVRKASLARRGGENFACTGSDCAGVVLGPLADDGSRTITFSNVTMIEQESYGLVGTRTATFDGSFTGPPPPPRF